MAEAAKIKRGGAKRPTVKRKPRVAKGNAPSAFARFLAAIPIRQSTLDRMISGALVVIIGGTAIGVAAFAGVPQYVGTEMAQAVGRAGFRVKRVEVTGIDRMERLTVYAIALDQQSMAMPLVDLDKVRNQLLQYGWIEDARISRRLPDTLVVDIIERKPAAIWQHNQKLSLIDGKGVVLEKLSANEPMPDLPLIIGADANTQAVALNQVIERAPSLRPMLASATWVGNRRWDFQFQSGETLALPEGDELAGKALLRFARIDGVQHLLGRQFVRFDMRDPTKFVARIGKKQPAIDESQPSEDANKEEASDGPA